MKTTSSNQKVPKHRITLFPYPRNQIKSVQVGTISKHVFQIFAASEKDDFATILSKQRRNFQ